MTKEEAIQALKKEKRTALHENKVAFDMAIKALEQEPVLDKISAEIEEAALDDANGSKFIFINRVNQIIDKYRTESENKE